jgi:uncharacterized protein (TIGR00251 family)
MRIIEARGGIILEILVKPQSERFRLDLGEDEIIVFCTEKPVRGKVNKELIKEFSRLFRKRVELVSGFSSKQKRLLVHEAKRAEIEKILTQDKANLRS